MSGHKKIISVDPQQVALVEHAQRRIAEKRRFHHHLLASLFIVFFSLLVNFVFDYKANFNPFNVHWSFVLIALLAVLILVHFLRVYVFHSFMGRSWETEQMTYLLEKQGQKLEKLERTMKQNNADTAREITIIAAAAKNNALGKDNKLLWHLSDDLKRFKSLTNGHHIIMGRKTFESMPKALPNRINVVITRQKEYHAEGAHVVHSLEAALAFAKDDPRPFIIGGGEIYEQGLAYADCVELTRVRGNFEADAFFPELDSSVWEEVWRENHDKDEKHKHAFSFIRYKKITL